MITIYFLIKQEISPHAVFCENISSRVESMHIRCKRDETFKRDSPLSDMKSFTQQVPYYVYGSCYFYVNLFMENS